MNTKENDDTGRLKREKKRWDGLLRLRLNVSWVRKETRVSKTGGEEKQELHDARVALGEAANKKRITGTVGTDAERHLCCR